MPKTSLPPGVGVSVEAAVVAAPPAAVVPAPPGRGRAGAAPAVVTAARGGEQPEGDERRAERPCGAVTRADIARSHDSPSCA